MKKYLVEFIGAFFLVLTIVLTVNGTTGNLAPLAIGLVLMVMVYAGGHISGAHYNPAVTLAIWLRGKCPAKDVPGYIIAQLIGAILAAFLGKYLLGSIPGAVGISEGGILDFIPASLAEFLGTFALCYVILNVATAKSTQGNSYFGLAIGLTITACAYGLGGVTGGAFNPAVATGISLAGMTPWANIAAFLVGQIVAALAATTVFSYINGPEEE